ncbi:hypothetical protein ABIA32_005704 [Streptacidiphilus sp. MAP12-20]
MAAAAASGVSASGRPAKDSGVTPVSRANASLEYCQRSSRSSRATPTGSPGTRLPSSASLVTAMAAAAASIAVAAASRFGASAPTALSSSPGRQKLTP